MKLATSVLTVLFAMLTYESSQAFMLSSTFGPTYSEKKMTSRLPASKTCKYRDGSTGLTYRGSNLEQMIMNCHSSLQAYYGDHSEERGATEFIDRCINLSCSN